MLSTLLLASGCLDDENLGLRDYPLNQPSLNMDYNDTKLKEDIVQATYDGDGTLVLDKELNRSYAIRLTPSPETTKVVFEPLLVNINADQVEYTSKGGTLKPGEVDLAVDVNFIGDMKAFEGLDEQTYEIGVRALLEGYNMPADEPLESKIIINKKAYNANIDFAGTKGNDVQFKRTYMNMTAEILEGEVSYTFKVVLDKPAVNDITVKLATSCEDKQALSGVTMPQEVTIPAGQKESELITWATNNDFLQVDNKEGTWKFEITPTLQGGTYCQVNENAKLSITVNKVVANAAAVPEVPADWARVDRTNLSIHSGNQVNNANDMLDDNPNSYAWAYSWYYYPHWFAVDLGETRKVKGFKLHWAKNNDTIQFAQKLIISTSLDGKNWESSTEVAGLESAEEHIIKFGEAPEARYIKIELADGKEYYLFISDLAIYE